MSLLAEVNAIGFRMVPKILPEKAWWLGQDCCLGGESSLLVSPMRHLTGEHPISVLSNISRDPKIEFTNSGQCGTRVE